MSPGAGPPTTASAVSNDQLAAGAATTSASFFPSWVETAPHSLHRNVQCLIERPGARDGILDCVCDAVEDHLVGARILARLEFPISAAHVESRMPQTKRARSGDLAEILATEYVHAHTDFEVPLKRLRHKDDREMAMRGDDIIALARSSAGPRILKGEVKSREALAPTVVGQACTALARHQGRPSPHTLSFIAMELRRTGRDADAARIEDLLVQSVRPQDVAHFVFTMSANDPADSLAAFATTGTGSPERNLVGLVVDDHQAFIRGVFERIAVRYATTAGASTVSGVLGASPAAAKMASLGATPTIVRDSIPFGPGGGVTTTSTATPVVVRGDERPVSPSPSDDDPDG